MLTLNYNINFLVPNGIFQHLYFELPNFNNTLRLLNNLLYNYLKHFHIFKCK